MLNAAMIGERWRTDAEAAEDLLRALDTLKWD
jgi:hypothetical protein